MTNDNGTGNGPGDDMGEDAKKDTIPPEAQHCDCMMDCGFDAYPKIYRISFRVYGIDSVGIKHVVVETSQAYMVGIDVEDIVNQLKSDHLNTEFNHHDGDGMYHIIGQDVVIHSVRYIGILNYMTNKAKKLFEIPDEESDLEES